MKRVLENTQIQDDDETSSTIDFQVEEEETKKYSGCPFLLAALLISLATSQVVYSNIATFLPPYRTEKHPAMTDTAVGVILAYRYISS